MSTVSATIGNVMGTLDVASYFEERRSVEEILTELADVRAGLSGIAGFSAQVLEQNLMVGLDASDNARALLAQYAAEPDAAARQSLAETAIADAQTGLDVILQQMQDSINSLLSVSLAYGFGTLYYAMLTRQVVADALQDGPNGAPGLTEQMTLATHLLFDAIEGEGLYSKVLNGLAQNIIVTNFVGTNADPQVNFDVVSAIGEIADNVTVRRLAGESNTDFQTRFEGVAAQQAEVVFLKEQAQFGAPAMREIGLSMNEWMAIDFSLVPDQHERIGTDAVDVQEGTALADYFSGLGGDDIFNGADGPDALSGGAGNDILRGGTFRDTLVGGEGNDLMFGGSTREDVAEGDTARFFGLAAEHVILGGTDYAVVTGPDGSRDKLFDVSFLRFDDGEVALQAGSALDEEGPFETLNKNNFVIAERVALLYEAALNRNGEIDLPGLNFYVDVTEAAALTDEFLAADLMESEEFTREFNAVSNLTNTEFLEQIYLNVLERPSDGRGLEFYLTLLNEGTISRALALADIAVSPENTEASAEILMSLYETTAPEIDTTAGIDIPLEWSFVA